MPESPSLPRSRAAGRWAAALALALALLVVVVPAASAKRYKTKTFAKVTVKKDLTYGSAPGADGKPEALKLDLYQPKGDKAKKRPVVIWVHGGGFSSGDKSSGPAPDLAMYFAKLGYVTASINYRLLLTSGCSGADGVTPACYDAALKDVADGQASVRWMRANAKKYKLDGTRIGIGGESAGAIMACGAGVRSATPGDSGNPGYSSKVQGFVSISGGLPNGLFVDANTAPGLLFHGTADTVVPYDWSVQTRDAMRKSGVPVTLKTLPGAGHVPYAQYGGVMRSMSTSFLYKTLRVSKLKG